MIQDPAIKARIGFGVAQVLTMFTDTLAMIRAERDRAIAANDASELQRLDSMRHDLLDRFEEMDTRTGGFTKVP